MGVNNTPTIQNTINWLLSYVQQRPMTGVAGVALEPSLTNANYAMQTILQPPFRWEWNRTKSPSAITTQQGQIDYQVALSTYGWLEKANVNFQKVESPSFPQNFGLDVYEVLDAEAVQGRPTKIAVLLDDNNGNITFRLAPCPDQVYNIDLVYQNAPIFATSLNTTWAPIPNKFAFLYERFMLAQFQMTYNQQLGLSNLEIFFRQLVAAAEGLSEMEKAIFLEDQLRIIRTRQEAIALTPQGKGARV
jgi:hypothetical protein